MVNCIWFDVSLNFISYHFIEVFEYYVWDTVTRTHMTLTLKALPEEKKKIHCEMFEFQKKKQFVEIKT